MKTVFTFTFCLFTFFAFSQKSSFQFDSNISTSDYAKGVVLVKLKKSASSLKSISQSRSSIPGGYTFNSLIPQPSILKSQGRMGPKKQHVDIGKLMRVQFDPSRNVEDAINELLATGLFEIVEPEWQYKMHLTPNDPSIGQQYYLGLIKALEAWDISQGDESIVIGIADSGGDLDHPDIAGQLYINEGDPVDGIDNDNDGYIDNYRGWDFSGADTLDVFNPNFTGDNDPSVPKGGLFSHGTYAAGCAAASTNNGIGIAGVGYKAKLMFTKHYSDNQATDSRYYSSSPYLGLLYLATQGAKILNASFGSSNRSQILQEIVNHITLDLGCLIVASAGNENVSSPSYPAAYDYVLSVAASNSADQKAAFSNYGNTVDITAPGVAIYTTGFDDTYASVQGTSFSAPIVSGAAAIVWAKNPSWGPLEVAEQLRVSADPNFYGVNPVFKNKLGLGRLDILRALTIESPSIRASNALFVDENGSPPEAGQKGYLYFDFKNFLTTSSSGLEVSITSNSPFLTINNKKITLGIIEHGATVRNTLNPIEISLHPATPLNQSMDIILTFTDGTYSDYQYASFIIPTFVEINENLVSTSIGSTGRIGFEDPSNQSNGVGFYYNDQSMLYEMGLLMGSSNKDIQNNVRGINDEFDQDFTSTTKIQKLTPGNRSYSEVVGSLRNGASDATKTLQIDYTSMVWQQNPNENFVILEYTIKNPTTNDMNNFRFGIFADWDISGNGATDSAKWDASNNMGYVFNSQSTEVPLAGIQLLTGQANYYAIDNNESLSGNPFGLYDGYTDEEKFTTLSTQRLKAGLSPTGSDVSQVISSGPHSINAGGEIKIAFAIHAANTLDGLKNSAVQADVMYNSTLLTSIPTANDVDVCFGDAATMTASGASVLKWYKNFTGGTAFHTGPSYTTGNLQSDTSFYVSNADQAFESVRKEIKVSLKANPKVFASGSTTICEGGEVTLFVDDADSYLWNTTETTRTIKVTSAGNYSVSVTNTALGCNSTSPPFEVKVFEKPTASFLSSEDLFSNTPVTFTDASTDATSWFWSFGDGSTSLEQSPTHQYAIGGPYSVSLTVTNANGCQDISILDFDIVTDIKEELMAEIKLFPIPILNNHLTVELPFSNARIGILRNDGRNIFESEFKNINGNVQLDFSNYPAGLYLIKVDSGNGSIVKKALKL